MASVIRVSEYTNIVNAPLPEHDKSYAVIPHSTVIERTRFMLEENGFRIKKEAYKATMNAQIATAKYDLYTAADDELGMMFAWVNSYDKSTTFKCVVGGNVFVCTNGMIHGDLNRFKRKHTGNALSEAIEAIDHQIGDAHRQYDLLLEAKNALKEVTISPRRAAELLGFLYADKGILTTTQAAIVKNEMKKPSYDYNAHKESAWPFYNHITHSLKESHPEKWIDKHANAHTIIMNELALN